MMPTIVDIIWFSVIATVPVGMIVWQIADQTAWKREYKRRMATVEDMFRNPFDDRDDLADWDRRFAKKYQTQECSESKEVRTQANNVRRPAPPTPKPKPEDTIRWYL